MAIEADLLTGDEHCEADKQQGESDQDDKLARYVGSWVWQMAQR
jgi:hypothetical protein